MHINLFTNNDLNTPQCNPGVVSYGVALLLPSLTLSIPTHVMIKLTPVVCELSNVYKDERTSNATVITD